MTETIIKTNLTTISNACNFYIDDLCECSKSGKCNDCGLCQEFQE